MPNPPSLSTAWADASPRPTNLKNALNDHADALNKLAAAGYDGWTTYTPTLTATVSNPNIGTPGTNGAASFGRYCKVGRLIVAQFGIRFAYTGATKGAGIYLIATPVALKTAAYTAGLTSDLIGTGNLYRGKNALDLVGAHSAIQLHTYGGSPGTQLVATLHGGTLGGDIARDTVTSNQTGIGTSPTDVTGLSIAYTPMRAGSRLKVTAEVSVAAETAGGGTIYAQITDGTGTVLKRSGAYVPVLGVPATGIGVQTVPISYLDEAPAFGTAKTYKVQVFGVGTNVTAVGTAEIPQVLEVSELAGSSLAGLSEQSDYVSATYPFEWDDSDGTATSGAEIWGLIIAEAAA